MSTGTFGSGTGVLGDGNEHMARPATCERHNGQMALTVLRPKTVLSEEVRIDLDVLNLVKSAFASNLLQSFDFERLNGKFTLTSLVPHPENPRCLSPTSLFAALYRTRCRSPSSPACSAATSTRDRALRTATGVQSRPKPPRKWCLSRCASHFTLHTSRPLP